MPQEPERLSSTVKERFDCDSVFAQIEKAAELYSAPFMRRPISIEAELKKANPALAELDKPRALVVSNLTMVKQRLLHVHRVLQTKISYLLRSAIYALNSENYLLFGMAARSLIEHLAAVSYLHTRFSRKLEKLKGDGDPESINRKLESVSADLGKMFYGTRFFENEGLVDAVHVNDLIKSLPESFTRMYDLFSDFVHPNYGSNVLVSEGELGEGRVNPPPRAKIKIVGDMIQLVGIILSHIKESENTIGVLGVTIGQYIQLALDSTRNLAKVFSRPSDKHEGDGNSKANAILFRRARTRVEHISLQYEYMGKVGFVPGLVSLEFDDDFLYDHHKSNDGDLWFKIPKSVMDTEIEDHSE